MVTDSVGAWFGAVVRRTGIDTADVTIPQPAPGTGASLLARMVQGADIAAGVCANFAAEPRSALTADLVLQVLSARPVGALTARGSILRAGRGQVVAEVDIVDERGVLVATASVNHGVRDTSMRMYLHDLRPGDLFDLAPYRTAPIGPLAEVFYDLAGELPVDAHSTNPWGVAQGALMSTLIEPAAVAAGLAAIEDLTIRFLAPATTGPVQFVTTSVSDRVGSRLLRGKIHDRGADRTVVILSAAGPRTEGAAP